MSTEELGTAYLMERDWLHGALLRLSLPVCYMVGWLLVPSVLDHLGIEQPAWLVTAMPWANAGVAFVMAAGMVAFGPRTLASYRRVRELRRQMELSERG